MKEFIYNYLRKVIQWYIPLKLSYFAINTREQLIWNTIARFLIHPHDRFIFEGNRQIPGQLWYIDRKTIYDCIKGNNPSNVYEVGTWKGGGSTYFIAQALYENGFGLLHTIEVSEDLYNQAKRNFFLYSPHLLPHISFNYGLSTTIFPELLLNYGVDVLFLDGLDGEQTLRDFRLFEPFFKEGGILIAHDWNDEKTSQLRPYIESNKQWQPLTIISYPHSVGIAIYRYSPNSYIYDSPGLISSVSLDRWKAAQSFEIGIWRKLEEADSRTSLLKKIINAPFIGRYLDRHLINDDWNYWWKEYFNQYDFLPKKMNTVIEVGCGPYTNIRLIRKISNISLIICSDPLIREYAEFHHSWISYASSRKIVALLLHTAEYIPIDSENIDCTVMINVLDHVADAFRCLSEATRILRRGGILVLGQDLTNHEDMLIPENASDIGHPIRLDQARLDEMLLQNFNPFLYKILPREAGRSPKYHYGTYFFAGQKR